MITSRSSSTTVQSKTPESMLIASVQELLKELFDPELTKRDNEQRNVFDEKTSPTSTSQMAGMGVSSYSSGDSRKSKYQGFGSTVETKTPVMNNVSSVNLSLIFY